MHNIFGDRFFGRTGPAWHEIGTTDPNITSCVKAMKKAKLDYNVILTKVVGQVQTPLGIHLVDAPNKSMIVREPTKDDPEYRVFGYASPTYGIVQNIDIAKALDVLTDEWPCETVGALGYGETVFFTLNAGKFSIKGEEVTSYFLVADTRDGGTSMKIAFTPVRVVCQNTLVTGLKQSLVSVSLEHVKGLKPAFENRISLVGKLNAAKSATVEMFNTFSKLKLAKKQVEIVMDHTYPLPKKPKKARLLDDIDKNEDLVSVLYEEASDAVKLWEYYCQRAYSLREATLELYNKHNDEFPKTANTAWGLYNAVVESADFRRGSESIPASTLWGPRAAEKKRAFASLVDLAE